MASSKVRFVVSSWGCCEADVRDQDRATTINEHLSALVTRAEVLYSDKPWAPVLEDMPSSPGFSITDGAESSEDEDQRPRGSLSLALPERPAAFGEEGAPSPRSPVEQVSRGMTLEEGEVFRKGTALGVGAETESDEEEGDVPGHELKETVRPILSPSFPFADQMWAQILEANVARSPRNSFSSPPSSPPHESDAVLSTQVAHES